MIKKSLLVISLEIAIKALSHALLLETIYSCANIFCTGVLHLCHYAKASPEQLCAAVL